MINFSYAMILKYLDPNAMLVNVNFNYLFSRMITYIKNGANKEYLTVAEFILLELCEILAIIAYMIYIELIELKFCRLDHDIKKQITERGIQDAFIDLNDFDEDDIPNNNRKKSDEDNRYYNINLNKDEYNKGEELIDKIE